MRSIKERRGFLLIFALLLTVLVTLIALSILGLKKGGYASSRAAINSVQARSLARSGMSDIWVKLSKDPLFPGGLGDGQMVFSYREEIRDSSNQLSGSYSVTMDRTYRLSHRIIRIESTGVSGALIEESSSHTIYAELSTELNNFRFKIWQEGTSPRL